MLGLGHLSHPTNHKRVFAGLSRASHEKVAEDGVLQVGRFEACNFLRDGLNGHTPKVSLWKSEANMSQFVEATYDYQVVRSRWCSGRGGSGGG